MRFLIGLGLVAGALAQSSSSSSSSSAARTTSSRPSGTTVTTAPTVDITSQLASSAVVTNTQNFITNTVTSIAPDATAYPINIGAINETIRSEWCDTQQTSCFSLCTPNGGPAQNRCDDDTLVWTCQCRGATTPNVADFNQTIPFFECLTYIDQCVQSTDNAFDQSQCLMRQCGGPVLPVDYARGSTTVASSTAASTSGSASSSAAATTTAASSSAAPTTTPSGSGNGGNGASTQVVSLGLGAIAGGLLWLALVF